MRTPIRLGLLLLLALGATGCQGKRTNITGTITRDGRPLVWPGEKGELIVIFVPEDVRRDPVRAEADKETGTYRVEQIPAGTYLVAVHQFDGKSMDALQNKFDPAKTKLRVEVTEDNQVIDIDLPKDLPKE